MIREIIVPTENSYILNLPDNLIGKKVEVIAFSSDDIFNVLPPEQKEMKRTLEQALLFFKKNSIDFTGVEKWDREGLYE